MENINVGELLQLGGLGAIAFFLVWFLSVRVIKALDKSQDTQDKVADTLGVVDRKVDTLLERTKK